MKIFFIRISRQSKLYPNIIKAFSNVDYGLNTVFKNV